MEVAASAAPACETPVTLTESQVRDGIAALESGDASPVDKIFTYRELVCSDDAAVRSLADLTAMRSGSPPLKSEVLLRVLLERQNLILTPYDNGDLSKEARAFAEANPSIVFKFISKDSENRCIGLREQVCGTTYVLDVRRTGVSIAYEEATAELLLNDDGILDGFYVPEGQNFRIPVRSRLF